MVWFWITLLVVLVGGNAVVEGANVTYDGRSLLIDGERKILFSGSIHYPRSTPDVSVYIFAVLVFLLLY